MSINVIFQILCGLKNKYLPKNKSPSQDEAIKQIRFYGKIIVAFSVILIVSWIVFSIYYAKLSESADIEGLVWINTYIIVNSSHITPWSVYLANFFQKPCDIMHIFTNVFFLLLFYLAISMSYNFRAAHEITLKKSFFKYFFLFCLFIAPFLISGAAILIHRDNIPFVGSSGIVYAFFGALAGISLYPCCKESKTLWKMLPKLSKFDRSINFVPIGYWIFCIFMFIAYMIYNGVIDDSKINEIGHIAGGICGILFALGFELVFITRRRKKRLFYSS